MVRAADGMILRPCAQTDIQSNYSGQWFISSEAEAHFCRELQRGAARKGGGCGQVGLWKAKESQAAEEEAGRKEAAKEEEGPVD